MVLQREFNIKTEKLSVMMEICAAKKTVNTMEGIGCHFSSAGRNADINGKRDVNQLTAHIDVFPTLVDLCGLKFVPVKALDGKSLMPLLKGDNDNWKERSIVTDSQREQNLVEWRKSSVMDDTWRLVNGEELYNIKIDPKQTKDLATDYPDKVKLFTCNL